MGCNVGKKHVNRSRQPVDDAVNMTPHERNNSIASEGGNLNVPCSVVDRINLDNAVETLPFTAAELETSAHPLRRRPINFLLGSRSLWFSLATMVNHRTFQSGIVIVDTRKRHQYEAAHVFGAFSPWPQTSDPTDLTEDEVVRVSRCLAVLCNLRSVLVYGSSNCSSSKELVIATLRLISQAESNPKEVIILDGGVDAIQTPPSHQQVSLHDKTFVKPSEGFYRCLTEFGHTRDSPLSYDDVCITEVLAYYESSLPSNNTKQSFSKFPPSLAIIEPVSPFGLYIASEVALFGVWDGKSSNTTAVAPVFLSYTQIKSIVNLTSTRCPLDRSRFRIYEPLFELQGISSEERNEQSISQRIGPRLPVNEVFRRFLPKTIDFVAEEATLHHSLLIYDTSGDYYASVAVVWFLIESGNSFTRALQFVQRRRPTIQFDSFISTFLSALANNLNGSHHFISLEDKGKHSIAAAREIALSLVITIDPYNPKPAPPSDKAAGYGTVKSAENCDNAGIELHTDYYEHIATTLEDFRRTVSDSEFNEAMSTLNKLFHNVLVHPNEPKYRGLKLSNQRFFDTVGRHHHAMSLLTMAGWIFDQEEGVVTYPKTSLMHKMREVKSQLPL